MLDVETKEQLDEVLANCKNSLELFCKTFLSERFDRPFSRQHYRLFELIDDTSIQKLLTLAHRGFGKTSIFNYALPAQAIAYADPAVGDFIVPISSSSTIAVLQAENLKRELMTNQMFKFLLGNLKTDTFSKDEWVTSNNVMVFPRGRGQQVRGILHGNLRPRLIIPDDLESSESVLAPEQRLKDKHWFHTDLANSVDRTKKDWRILAVGTILHEDSLLQKLREDKTWTVIEMPLCDEQYKSYWPMSFPDSQVKELLDEYKDGGMLEQFYMEFMNIANPAEDAPFRAEMFKYYEETDFDLNDDPDVENIVIVDPAKTEKVHSAFSAIVGVGVDSTKNKIYVRDIVNRRMKPDQIYLEAFEMADRLNASTIGFEVTGLNEFITQPFISEMHRRGKVYELIELKARRAEGEYVTKGSNRGKAARIAQLSTYYRLGKIFHNASCCGVLETQLISFPKARYWDVMDAFAYTIEMMEIGGRYFSEERSEGLSDVEAEILADEDRLLEHDYELLMAEDEDPVEYRILV